MSKELVDKTAEIVMNNKGYFIYWSQLRFASDEGHQYTRLDKVFLNVLFNDGNTPFFHRIAACRVEDDMGGPRYRYVLEQAYRVTSGARKGCVVAAHDVQGSEFYQPAGVRRQLAYGPSPYLFHSNHLSDAHSFAVMRALPHCEQRTTVVSCMPDLLHTYRPDQGDYLSLRQTGSALRWLRATPGYQNALTGQENLRVMHGVLAQNTGMDRWALPYDMVFGRGVVVATEAPSMEFEQWYNVPCMEGVSGALEVSYEFK